MAVICVGQEGVYRVNLLPGKTKSYSVNINYGDVDCDKFSGGWGGGISSAHSTVVIDSVDTPVSPVYGVTVHDWLITTTTGGMYQLTFQVTTAADIFPPKTELGWYFNLSSSPLDGSGVDASGSVQLQIYVDPVYEFSGFFTYPHPGAGQWYINKEDLAVPSTLVDFSASGAAPYRLYMVGRLSRAAVADPAGFTSLTATYKTFNSSNTELIRRDYSLSSPYPTDWHSQRGDPFCQSHTFVTVATVAPLNLSNAILTIDGITLTVGDIVLVKDQTQWAQNGIYVFGNDAHLTRHSAMDLWSKVPNASVYVNNSVGTWKNTNWITSSYNPPGASLGTTFVQWYQSFSTDLRISGSAAAPPDMSAFGAWSPSSAYGSSQIAKVTGEINYNAVWTGAVSATVIPFIQSVISPDALDEGVLASKTFEAWANAFLPPTITFYPAVAKDSRYPADHATLLTMEMSTVGSNGPWSPVVASDTAYTSTLTQGNSGTTFQYDGSTYTYCTFQFRPKVAGTYWFRTVPTADKNTAVRSTQEVKVIAYAAPNASVTLGAYTVARPDLNGFSIPITTSSNMGSSCSLAIVNPTPSATYDASGTGIHENIALYDTQTSSVVGTLLAPGVIAGIPISTSGRFELRVPNHVSPKLALQAFSNILKLTVVVGTLNFDAYSFVDNPKYNWPDASITLSDAVSTITLDGTACSAAAAKTFTKTLGWSNHPAATAISLTSTVPVGKGTLTVSPSSYTPTTTSGTTTLTYTYTPPSVQFTENVTATVTAVVGGNTIATRNVLINGCAGAVTAPTLETYGTQDKEIIFYDFTGFNSLCPTTYTNETPSQNTASKCNYFVGRVGALRDTTTNFIIEASPDSSFASGVQTITDASATPQTRAVTSVLDIVVTRSASQSGNYVANEVQIQVLWKTGASPTAMPEPIYIRARASVGATPSAIRKVTPLPMPFIFTPSRDANYGSTSVLYLESGSGILLNLVTSVPGIPAFLPAGGSIFSLVNSTGLFAGPPELFDAPVGGSGANWSVYWNIVGNTGTHTASMVYNVPSGGTVVLGSFTCKVVSKAPNVNMGVVETGRPTVANVAKGTTCIPKYNAITGVETLYTKITSAGVRYPSSSSISFDVAALEPANAIYAAITFRSPDPISPADPNGVTLVAVKATLTSAAGCGSTTTPINLVPIVASTYYPPYISELDGLKLPTSVLVGSVDTPVTGWTFGSAKGWNGTSSLEMYMSPTEVGYPATTGESLRFQLLNQSGVFKFRAYNNTPVVIAAAAINISRLDLEFKASYGTGSACVSRVIQIPVSFEQCTELTPELVNLSSSHPIYSCDSFPRIAPAAGMGGYNTGILSSAALNIHTFIENGWAIPMGSSTWDTTHLVNYGLEIVSPSGGTSYITTGASDTFRPAKRYSGVNLDSYNLFITTTTHGGVTACTKKIYKETYVKNYPDISTWLPKPIGFFVGTSATLKTATNVYDGEDLYVQLQPLVSSLIGSKITSEYKLMFSPVSGGATPTQVAISQYSEAGIPALSIQPRTIKYSVLFGGLQLGMTYVVSVLHAGAVGGVGATGCAYTAWSSGVTEGTVGTITYKGPKVASTVFFNSIPPLDPCFQNIAVTTNTTQSSGLTTVARISIYKTTVISPETLVTEWSNISPSQIPTANDLRFNLGRSSSFPTTRDATISKTFYVMLYSSDGTLLTSNPIALPLSLKAPVIGINETNPIRAISIGTPVNGYENTFTVVGLDSTCCASCSSGTCSADTFVLGAAPVWTLISFPPWATTLIPGTGVTQNTAVLRNNGVVVAGSPSTVTVRVELTYYGATITKDITYQLAPTNIFTIGTSSIPDAHNGELLYNAYIPTVAKPATSCSTLSWAIESRSVDGAPSLPLGVTIEAESGTDETRGKVSWSVVADPLVTFPVIYKFHVRASCNGGSASAEGDITFRVTQSTPSISSVVPLVGYFDILNSEVTITGSSFSTAVTPTVRFGNLLATDVVVNPSGTIITCIPPMVADLGGPDLAVDLTVVNSDGGSATYADQYRYVRQHSPILLGISPSSGTPLGGTKVLLTGANFEPSSVVTIDGVEQPIVAITPSSLLFITNPHSVGDVNVVVSNSNCGGTQGVCPSIVYTFRVSPQILSVTPYNTSSTGQDAVFIVGTGFYVNGTTQPRVLVDNFEIPASLITYRVV